MKLRSALPQDLEQRCIQTIRMMAVDGIEKAASGHPGACMGTADMVFTLWSRVLHFDPTRPDWVNRDRFVLSGGHASMLLYSLLHLFGYDASLEDLKQFRQLNSRTPGHPEYGFLPGVEVTTGPLGQGFAHGVGLALAGKMLASRLNQPDNELINYRVFGVCGDGDLMEGVAAEAASLAGHLQLDNLLFLYDSNRITIEGSTDLTFSEDVAKRFEAYGWHVVQCDGHDTQSVSQALQEGLSVQKKPTLIIGHTTIGYGAPTMAGLAKTHGSPLGAEEIRRAKEAISWPLEPTFYVPDDAREAFAALSKAGTQLRLGWEEQQRQYQEKYPRHFQSWMKARDNDWEKDLPDALLKAATEVAGKATRVISGAVIQAAAQKVPWLVGGSADLAPSTSTLIKDAGHVGQGEDPFAGHNLHFGIREHAMGSIVNGMALEKSFRPFGATFLVFSDYMKPALRMSALMESRSIFVFTHDSVGVGEDGPTHQPIEQLWMLRGIPGMTLFRPADALEVAAAWYYAIAHSDGPVCIALTRQNVSAFTRDRDTTIEEVLKGGTIVCNPTNPAMVIVATGSEVPLAVEAQKILQKQGLIARVVSMCSVERFLKQPESWQEEILGDDLPIVTLEAGITTGWHRFAGRKGLTIGLDRFGASAPIAHLQKALGLTPEAIAEKILNWKNS